MPLDLTQLLGKPEIKVTIGGSEYQFSELSIDALAELQSWIREHTPHPIESIKGYLDGMQPEDRRYLLDQARIDAKAWPPQIGTPAGSQALLGNQDGQAETLYHGLRVHQPDMTRESARRIYRDLLRSKNEALVSRIFGVLFGMPDTSEEAPSKKG